MSARDQQAIVEIVEALGLSPQAGAKLVEVLDRRYQRPPDLAEIAEAKMHAKNLDAAPVKVGDVIPWGKDGTPHRVGRCSDGNLQCMSCERRGWHIEPTSKAETDARPWGVWCIPIPVSGGRKPCWLHHLIDSDYVLRATNEAIADEMNSRSHAKHWRHEARPVMPDGMPGEVP
jgi:hypothetical protein